MPLLCVSPPLKSWSLSSLICLFNSLDTAHDLLFRDLAPLDLYNYSKANKEAYQSITSFRRRAYTLNKYLLPYFTEQQIAQFRDLQKELGILISGSTAIHFSNAMLESTWIRIWTCTSTTVSAPRSGHSCSRLDITFGRGGPSWRLLKLTLPTSIG